MKKASSSAVKESDLVLWSMRLFSGFRAERFTLAFHESHGEPIQIAHQYCITFWTPLQTRRTEGRHGEMH